MAGTFDAFARYLLLLRTIVSPMTLFGLANLAASGELRRWKEVSQEEYEVFKVHEA